MVVTKQQIRILLWLTKKQHFVLSLGTDILEMQQFVLKVDAPYTTTNLMVDTRVNKMKSRDPREV